MPALPQASSSQPIVSDTSSLNFGARHMPNAVANFHARANLMNSNEKSYDCKDLRQRASYDAVLKHVGDVLHRVRAPVSECL